MGKNYYTDDGYWSQSKLKTLVGYSYDSRSQLGSVTDCLVTTPDEFDVEYVIFTNPVPDGIREVIDNLLRLGFVEDNVGIAMGNYGKGSYSVERVWKEVNKYEEYVGLANEYPDKTLVSLDTYATALKMADVVLTHPRTSFIKGLDTQVELRSENLYGLKAKGLLDFLGDRVVDLKTVFDYSTIYTNFWKYRYDIQMAWYNDLANLKTMPRLIFISPGMSYPVVIECHPMTIEMGRSGGYKTVDEITVNNRTRKITEFKYGYQTIIDYMPVLLNHKSYEAQEFNRRMRTIEII